MEFADLKKKIQQEVDIEEVDFIQESHNNIPVGFFQLNSIQRLLFSIQEYRGRKYFDIRTWYQADSGEWKPTKKGVHLSFDKFEDFKKYCSLFDKIIPLDTGD